MPIPSFVFVIVAPPPEHRPDETRRVPLPAAEASDAGGVQMQCVPGTVYRVRWSTYTRKRIAGGDFLLTCHRGKPVKSEIEANADKVPDGFACDAHRVTAVVHEPKTDTTHPTRKPTP